MSLANHLALAACRREGGANSHLINELLEALYIAFYLQELGFGDESPELYAEAELAMNAVLTRAEAENVWLLDAEAAAIMERVLRLHDAQLNAISLRHLQDAQKRLDRYIQSGEPSPLLTNERAQRSGRALPLGALSASREPTRDRPLLTRARCAASGLFSIL